MSGWIILFTLLSVLGATLAAFELPSPAIAPIATSVVFATLSVVFLLMRLLRGRA